MYKVDEFGRSVLIGVVFDISLNHPDGIQTFKVLKDSLLQYTIETQPYTRIYVSHPESRVPSDQGQSTYFLTIYKEPQNFSVDRAFKDAVVKIGDSQEDGQKMVILFTNCFQAPLNQQYRKAFLTNNIRGYNTKICVVGIGSVYDRNNLNSIVKEYDGCFYHISTYEELFESIKQMVVE